MLAQTSNPIGKKVKLVHFNLACVCVWAGVVKQSPLSVVLLLPSALPTVQLVTLIPENTAVYKITTIKSGKIQTEKRAEKS